MIVGFGGGSLMDCVKGVNFIVMNGGEMWDYWGVGKVICLMFFMIVVLMIVGMGSEF